MIENLDARFSAYINVYNNLDKLLWSVPGFFVAAAAVLLGFAGNILSKPEASLPAIAWAVVFLLAAIFFLLGTYSMFTIRFHHNRMGDELTLMEPRGYFHSRSRTVKSGWPPAAPRLFMLVFGVIGVLFLVLALLAARSHPWLVDLLRIT